MIKAKFDLIPRSQGQRQFRVSLQNILQGTYDLSIYSTNQKARQAEKKSSLTSEAALESGDEGPLVHTHPDSFYKIQKICWFHSTESSSTNRSLLSLDLIHKSIRT